MHRLLLPPLALALALLLPAALAQAPRNNARGAGTQPQVLQAIQPGSPPEQARARIVCDAFFRTLNGVCTNPFFKVWGSSNRAQSSLFFTHSSRFPTGGALPSARFLSNALLKQSTDVFNDRNLNELVVFFGQIIDHTFVATPAGDEQMPIPIPEDDPIFGNFTNGQLRFTRSERARVDILGLFGSAASGIAKRLPGILKRRPSFARSPGVARDLPGVAPIRGASAITARQQLRPNAAPATAPAPATETAPATAAFGRIDPRAPSGGEGPNQAPSIFSLPFFFRNERPVNALSSAVDLSSVYGVDDERNQALRAAGCKLNTSPGDLLPLNTFGLNNAPTSEDIYFLAGDHRVNEHPVLTSLHTIFLREHNDICDELQTAFPDMSGEEMYKNARKINWAQFQKIVFEEYYPAMTNRNLPTYQGFRFYRNVNIIDVFSTAAFRVGHTMVGNQISRRGPGNSPLPPLPISEMFFRLAATFQGPEEFLRGAMQTKAQEIDLKIHDSLRNFLFTDIPEENVGFDLASLNIQRGRDHALPSFNAIRQRIGIAPATTFAGISSDPNVQSALSSAYNGQVNDVEVWIGLIAEDHAPGSSLGRTMLALWERQFVNLRDGDRFFFRNDIFSSTLKAKIPRINKIFTTSQLLREIFVRNSDVTVGEIPSSIFFT